MRRALRREGVYLPKAKAIQQRVERLQAIAAKFPKLTPEEVIEKYCQKYGETLSVRSTLVVLRQQGIVLGSATGNRRDEPLEE